MAEQNGIMTATMLSLAGRSNSYVDRAHFVALPPDDDTTPNQASSAPSADSEVTYEDDFVRVHGQNLTIKHYSIFRSIHTVPIASIEQLYPIVGNINVLWLKVWGLGGNGIMWARDWGRLGSWVGKKDGVDRGLVIKLEDHAMRIGFSVSDRAKFFEALEKVSPGVTKKGKKDKSKDH